MISWLAVEGFGDTYVGSGFEALEGDGEEFGFAGCEGRCWLWGGHFGKMLYGWLMKWLYGW